MQEKTKANYDVFISYSRKDFEEVNALKSMLEKRILGLSCWFDMDGIESGEQFSDKIISAIDRSVILLFAISKAAMASEWTKKEVTYARNTNKKIIPVLLNGAKLESWFLFEYGQVDCIDINDSRQVEKMIGNLSKWFGKEKVDAEKEDYINIHVNSASDLSLAMAEYNRNAVSSLKITGRINARDIKYLKEHCTSLANLDLSEVVIDEYEGRIGTNNGEECKYEANEIPLGAFFLWSPEDEGMPSLKKVILPEGITAIRRNAFARAYNLVEVRIPQSVEYIDFVAFAICISLRTLTIPSHVLKLGDCSFHNCKKLKSVYAEALNPPILEADVFVGIDPDAVLYVHQKAIKKYKASDWSKYFKNIVAHKF